MPQGTAGPANADAEISANKQVSSDITLLDQHGSEVLLGETLMVPIANSMVYLRPLYASPTTNPQPQLQYVVGVLGKNVQIDTSLSAVLSDLLNTTVSLPSESGGVSSTGTVPAAVAGILQQAQTDYTNALAALKAGNLAQFQTDVNAMQAAIAQAQQVIGATTPGATDDHHDHDDATGQGREVDEEGHDDDDARIDDGLHDDHLGAREHGAEEHDEHHLDDPGLGGTQDLSGGSFRLRPEPDRRMMGDEARKGSVPMGLLDKVKAQATAATEMAKDAAAKGQAKMNDAQAKKTADGMLRDLGAAFYATKTGRSTPSHRRRDCAAGDLAAGARVRARPDHAGTRVGRSGPDGNPGRLTARRPRAPPPPPEGGRPVLPAAAPAHGADAVGRFSRWAGAGVSCRTRRRGGGPAVHVGCPLRRGVEQSGSSSGS